MARYLALTCLLVAALSAGPAHAEAPGHDDRASARPISLPSSEQISTTQATTEPDERSPSCGSIGKTVWYRFAPAVDTELVVDIEDSNFEVRMAVYIEEPSGDLREVVCSRRHMDTGVRGGTTAYVQVGGAMLFGEYGFYLSPESGTATLAFSTRDELFFSPPPNDEMSAATVIDALPYSDMQNIYYATVSPDEPRDCVSASPIPLDAQPGTIWYRYTATSSRPLAASVYGFYNGLSVAVYRDAPDGLHLVGCKPDDVDDSKALVFTPVADATYLIQATKDRRSDQIAQDLGFGLREAREVDFAVKGVAILPSPDPRYNEIEVEVATQPGGFARLTLFGCASPGAQRCSVLDRSTDYYISSQWCVRCTVKMTWNHTYPVCGGTVTLKATIEGYGTVDPDPSNDSASTTVSLIGFDAGVGGCLP